MRKLKESVCPACGLVIVVDDYEDECDTCGQVVHRACEDWITYDMVVCHWCVQDAVP